MVITKLLQDILSTQNEIEQSPFIQTGQNKIQWTTTTTATTTTTTMGPTTTTSINNNNNNNQANQQQP